MDQSFVGRQPIYRQGVEVFGYELRSRNDELNRTASAKDSATATALLNEFVDVGLEQVAGGQPGFVDVTRDFILSQHCSNLPKNGVVLQVAANAPADDSLLTELRRLSGHGYSIALKDYVYREEIRPLTGLAGIVKINIRGLDRSAIAEQVNALRQFDVKLLAEQVETHEDYQYCKDLGFDYFEGYFFCKPQVTDDLRLPANRLSTMHLLSKLQDASILLDELERAVGQDLAMSYRILRYLNSPLNSLPRRVDSIRHAIALVGTDLIRQWASVIWLESIEDKPRELMVMAMVRAHMCQQLGAAMSSKNVDQFFTVGLLSLLDALLDRPMGKILEHLPLIEPIKGVLVERKGPMGAALKCIEAYERCDWNNTSCLNLDEKKIREAYLNAVAWSRTVIQELVN